MNIGFDIHNLSIAGQLVPTTYIILLLIILVLGYIVYLSAKYLFIPFMKKKWETVEKVGEMLPVMSTLVTNVSKYQESFDTLNNSVRKDLVHEVANLRNSITGIMAMVDQTQKDNKELAIEHAKLRGEHDIHVSTTNKRLGEITDTVHEILKGLPKHGQKDN